MLPGGVNSPVRAMRAIGRDPIFIERGDGAEIVDVDGNRYVDYVCSWGALVAGHAHPAVLAAVAAAAAAARASARRPRRGELAEEVAARVPGAEMLRMTSSGTEAAMTAIRLARAHTGRDVVIKFAGAYHGHSDGLLVAGRIGPRDSGHPVEPGRAGRDGRRDRRGAVERPRRARARTRAPRRRGDHRRALPANMGLVPPAAGFLELLRERADACGALLILDEVISGFRVARGGEASAAACSGDLVVLGKILGGGLPAAALAGPRELLELLAPVGEVYQAGTLSGNPLAVAAGLATLALLDDAAYATLEATTRTLAEGLREAAGERAGERASGCRGC